MTTRSAGEPSAELLSFDSEFWGVRIAKAPALMDDWALDNTIGCMWILIPASEQADIHRAEQNGARVMDIRVELERGTDPVLSYARPFNKTDVGPLAAISRTAFRGLTRFYADPRFPDERCDDLYENWLRQSADGWAEEILVLDDADGPVGFVTVHADDDHAWIGIIAVAEHIRGSGGGVSLTQSAVDWAYHRKVPRISVATQACNIPAQRAFQRAGFLATKTDIWLHKHFYD